MTNWQTGLAASAAAVSTKHLTDLVIDRLRSVLLHNLAWGLGSVNRPAAQAARSISRAWGEGDHPFLGRGSGGLLGAIFTNATAIAASIQDDAHSGNHLGGVLVPVALAVGAAERRAPAEVLLALSAGYGAAVAAASRWGRATGPRGFRGTALYGQIGAAVVASRLLGLDTEGISRALATAATTPGGTTGPLQAGNDEVLFQSGLAAVKGTLAALTAAEPIAVSTDGFDASAFFGAAYGGVNPAEVQATEPPSPAGLVETMLEVALRPYPLNQFCIAPVAAALEAAGGPLEIAAVEEVRLWMPADEARAVGGKGPFARPMQAMFSAPVAVAAALRDGGLSLQNLLGGAADTGVLALATRVEVAPDPALAPMTARVEIQVQGRTLRGAALDADFLHRPPFAVAAERVRNGVAGVPPAQVAALVKAVAAFPADHAALVLLVGALG